MKFWKVDSYCIGCPADCDYDNTNEVLMDVLNTYEKQGAVIREILESTPGNFRIIYTVEDVNGTYGI